MQFEVEVDQDLLDERRRLGADLWDEMWEGVLHMVPAPSGRHQRFLLKLGAALLPLAEDRGLLLSVETNLEHHRDDYRVPDLAAYTREQASDFGVWQRAELVLEIVSPGDESRKKLPWYAAQGVAEILLIDRDTLTVELYVSRDGQPNRVEPPRSDVLGCAFERVDDDTFRVVTDAGTTEITLMI
ncbi:MAG: Uma2 family endonuclease [Acidimicrobiales bacterium]